jgi:amino acid transporter
MLTSARLFSIIALIGTMLIVLSLGEIASIYPTAGGMSCTGFVISIPRCLN